jgi:hypothetical protein
MGGVFFGQFFFMVIPQMAKGLTLLMVNGVHAIFTLPF